MSTALRIVVYPSYMWGRADVPIFAARLLVEGSVWAAPLARVKLAGQGAIA